MIGFLLMVTSILQKVFAIVLSVALLFSAGAPIFARSAVTKYKIISLGSVTPVAINDRQILVSYRHGSDKIFGVWQHGQVHNIGLRNVVVWGMNNRGAILLTRNSTGGIFRRGTVKDLGRPFFGINDLRGLNDRDEMVGAEADGTPVLVGPAHKTVLQEIRGSLFRVTELNDRRQVVGVMIVGRKPNLRLSVFLWQDRRITILNSPGVHYIYAVSINNLGQVVGESRAMHEENRHATLWTSGRMVDLNTALPAASGWTLSYAIGINDKGEILGSGYYHGKTAAFLLIPAKS